VIAKKREMMQLRTRLIVIVTTLALLLLNVSPAFAAGPTPETNAVAINTIWTLLAAFLVFIMHAGFAMVETGFTRTKNSVNILMKNLITVAVGAIGFFFIGFALMFGPDLTGLIGTAGFALSARHLFDFGVPLEAFWFFQAVFAATCAMIVSGALAERTRFSAYWVFAIILSAGIYAVSGHWVWGGGWLGQLHFVDFAGSTVVHSVGGWSALVGALLVGPRLGKYRPDGQINPIMDHNIPLATLGVLLVRV